MQAIIDERADDKQRDGLLTVLHGGETDEAKTHWWVFHAMSSTVHEPIFRRTQWLQGRQLRLKSRSSARRGRAICHRARPSERPLASQGWPLTRVVALLQLIRRSSADRCNRSGLGKMENLGSDLTALVLARAPTAAGGGPDGARRRQWPRPSRA